MADEALEGRTGVATFVEAGKRHYRSMLGAYLDFLGASFVVGFAVFFVALAVGVSAVAAVGVAAYSLFNALFVTFSVAFYRRLVGAPAGRDPAASTPA